jgi:hypothetical protein
MGFIRVRRKILFLKILISKSLLHLGVLDYTISRKIDKMQREISRETEMLLKNLSSGLEEKVIEFL